MNIRHIANFVQWSQDGAIWNGYFFTINAKGLCHVYDLNAVGTTLPADLEEIDSFTLDKAELIVPHSNAVTFGNEYYAQGDEFPLLYSNIYNNYAKTDDPKTGVCLAYRIQRNKNKFTTTLVQIIEIGFAKSSEYWCSENGDVRPYGNFVVDGKGGKYYAFTMRDEAHTTRYFEFDLPKLSDGVIDETYGVRKVTLGIDNINSYFDCEYHNYIQGACFHNGKVYSVEGFSLKNGNAPALRVIDIASKRQELHIKFADFDLDVEPEMIDFWNDECYYCDAHGHMYKIEF